MERWRWRNGDEEVEMEIYGDVDMKVQEWRWRNCGCDIGCRDVEQEIERCG